MFMVHKWETGWSEKAQTISFIQFLASRIYPSDFQKQLRMHTFQTRERNEQWFVDTAASAIDFRIREYYFFEAFTLARKSVCPLRRWGVGALQEHYSTSVGDFPVKTRTSVSSAIFDIENYCNQILVDCLYRVDYSMPKKPL